MTFSFCIGLRKDAPPVNDLAVQSEFYSSDDVTEMKRHTGAILVLALLAFEAAF